MCCSGLSVLWWWECGAVHSSAQTSLHILSGYAASHREEENAIHPFLVQLSKYFSVEHSDTEKISIDSSYSSTLVLYILLFLTLYSLFSSLNK